MKIIDCSFGAVFFCRCRANADVATESPPGNFGALGGAAAPWLSLWESWHG